MDVDSPPRIVHVVAALIRDARGRVLLGRRTAGRDLAGAWEFPGGKVEPGETPEAALRREIREELGVDVEPGPALIAVPYAYPTKRILLDVRAARVLAGKPRGQERQALAWVAPEQLHRYPMPAADKPVVAALREPERYLITPEPADDAGFLATIDRAFAGGIRRLQLRLPQAEPSRWRRLASVVAERARNAGAMLLLNGDIALARELGTGVHLRSTQLRDLDARPLPDGSPVAASCHDVDELQHAERLGCDFAVLSPVRAVPSHPHSAPLGWERFADLRAGCSLPLYALGGLGPDDLADARRHGAQGIAAIRGLWPGEA